MKCGLGNLVLAAGDYGQLIGLAVLMLLSLLGSLAKKRAEQRERERQAHSPAPKAQDAPQTLKPPPPMAPKPARPPIRTQMPGQPDRSVGEIVEAMRRATREQAQKASSAQKQPQQLARQPRSQPDQSRHDSQEHAQQQAQRNVQHQAQRAPQARPTAPKPGRPVQAPAARSPEPSPVPLGSVSDRALMLGATGREVDEEIAHLRARLAQAERVREEKLTQHGGLLQHGAEHGATPADLLRADLVEAAELRRAIIYSEILGKPLAIRRESPAWDSF
jgi:hypothetical protein